jgi:hypothetical protein
VLAFALRDELDAAALILVAVLIANSFTSSC